MPKATPSRVPSSASPAMRLQSGASDALSFITAWADEPPVVIDVTSAPPGVGEVTAARSDGVGDMVSVLAEMRAEIDELKREMRGLRQALRRPA